MGINIVVTSRDKLQQEEIGILLEEDLKVMNECHLTVIMSSWFTLFPRKDVGNG